jgi:alkanesulfonate monooxygenase SsuD/methylene tetrahydromethanopterin reductase-like flavin-dependent oxidoreductase (luciferase family)
MQIGVVFPQTEFGGDVGAVRAYAQGVDDLGFRHLIAYDHVLGADPAVHRDWTHRYTAATTFHEPFVLFGHLAALTGLELVTSVLVLPQRQTALVAKQAAEVDLLSRGRLRLGVGVGWNRVEYEGLGKDFESRGRSLDEQIGLDRAQPLAPRRHRHPDRGRDRAAAGATSDPCLDWRPFDCCLPANGPAG